MMDPTLLILSDSHRYTAHVTDVIRRVRPAGILHAGDGLADLAGPGLDCPVWAVRGNGESWFRDPVIIGGVEREAFDEDTLVWEGLRILLCHGHRYHVKRGLSELITHAIAEEVDAVVFGHTHVPMYERIPTGRTYGGVTLQKPLHVFNPGSIGPGRSIGETPTFGTLTVRGGVPLFAHGEL